MPDRAWKGRKKIPGSSGATSPRSAAQPLTNIPGCTGPSLRPAKPEPRQPGGCKLKTAPVRPVVAARPAEYVCSEDLFY
uniref:Uncharacterized protein n=1 Tax=Escherichia coli TaxID=562 RepID=A0A1Z1V0T2_ECOLX|nr:hypothetical protein [Escherichia coli]